MLKANVEFAAVDPFRASAGDRCRTKRNQNTAKVAVRIANLSTVLNTQRSLANIADFKLIQYWSVYDPVSLTVTVPAEPARHAR